MTGTIIQTNRRLILLGAAAAGAAGLLPRYLSPASAQSGALAATETMRGGANNYIPGAPMVDNLGTGFTASGIVREAGSGKPLRNLRIQIWAATERGGEREPSNRGSVVTDANGRYRLEISPIVPQFGQPHIHIAYDDPGFATLFLRPVLNSRHDKSMVTDFVLAPAAANGARQG
ncbi:MAG: twin-arginine translocation pathway signal [Stutzerimonas stutzeri]|uniref:Twin-arginine translocation pathway signal n=1 Tax=Bosea eneae TaxID=151454 RepID=A0ABW0IQC9_9HYPH|nr:MAG: twin-arginine translocation pathway signal [Stutzerimonas stutzeri]